MPSIHALTNEASAVLAERRGEPREALRRLHLARQLWSSVIASDRGDSFAFVRFVAKRLDGEGG
jgi:hypothetical protein